MVKLEKGRLVDELVEYYEVTEKYRYGKGSQLFDFLASCIADFVKKHPLSSSKHSLGFTFSFPMAQKAIDKAYLNTWTKSFNCPDVVNEDVGALLEAAINRRKDLNIEVVAVLNDTTGTLVQGSYLDKNCAMGLILGTGNNGCYIEKAVNIEKWEGDHADEEVIVDIEWGSFGDNGVLDFVRTQWDDAVDSKSLMAKSFTFEKYIGGRYIGDLVREVLFTLSEKELFSKGQKLQEMGSLKTSSVAAIEREYLFGSPKVTENTLKELGLDCDEDDVHICQYVCGLISYRAVLLVSIICGVLLERMERQHATIAIDGSLYEGHPRFQPLLECLISQYAPSNPFSLMLAKDGSGKGAGLVAAIEQRRKQRR